MKATIAKVVLLVVSLVVVFGLAEIVLRLVPGPVDGLRGLHQPEPNAPWLYSLRPGARSTLEVSGAVEYRINADGYRGPRVSANKAPGTQRIAIVGDSVAFGYGVDEEDTFARQLEASAVPEPLREVVNLGVGGFNPYNEAAFLEGKAMALDPDIVLTQFCINDLNDPAAHFDAQTRLALGEIPDAAYPDPAERRSAAAEPSCWTRPCSCSRVCSAVRAALFERGGPEPALDLAALKPRELPPGTARTWLGDIYGQMQRAATDGGARFAVVVFPYRDQVEGNASSRIQGQLREMADERGIEMIDLLPAFQADPKPNELFLDAWHPTARGHALAAREIQEQLQSRGWVPASPVAP